MASELEDWSHVAVSYDGSAEPRAFEIYHQWAQRASNIVSATPGGRFREGGEIFRPATRIGARRSKANSGICESTNVAFIQAKRCQIGSSQSGSHGACRSPAIAGPKTRPKWLRDYFLIRRREQHRKTAENTDLTALNKGLDEINTEIPSTMVMGEMEKPRDTFILATGDYRNQANRCSPTRLPSCRRFPKMLRATASRSRNGR